MPKSECDITDMINNDMFVFKKDDVENILSKLGYVVSKEREISSGGKKASCASCDTDLTTEDLGMVIPKGSVSLLCRNPACLSKFLARMEKGEI